MEVVSSRISQATFILTLFADRLLRPQTNASMSKKLWIRVGGVRQLAKEGTVQKFEERWELLAPSLAVK